MNRDSHITEQQSLAQIFYFLLSTCAPVRRAVKMGDMGAYAGHGHEEDEITVFVTGFGVCPQCYAHTIQIKGGANQQGSNG